LGRSGRSRTQEPSFSQSRPYDAALTADIVPLATQYGRYGYRRIAAMLRAVGWAVNVKRVERIWRREGLKVSARPFGAFLYVDRC
jgi:putative transposase